MSAVAAGLRAEAGVPPRVAEVDHQAQDQPDEQPQPVLRAEEEHHAAVDQDAHGRDQGHHRGAERPRCVGIGHPHDPDRRRDDHEREQGADAHQVGEELQRRQRGRRGDDHAHQDRRFPGRLEPRVDRGEEPLRQQAVAGHRQQDPRLAQVADQERAGHPRQDAERDQSAREGQSLGVQRRRERCADVDLAVREHAGQHGRDRDVQHRADGQRPHDADCQVALGPAGLLGVGRDRVEPDVGEEDPPGPLGDPAPAVLFVQERLPVRGRDVGRADPDHRQDDADVEQHHRRVEPGAFPHADHQDHRHDGRDEDRGQVDPRLDDLSVGQGDFLEIEDAVRDVIIPGRRPEARVDREPEDMLQERIEDSWTSRRRRTLDPMAYSRIRSQPMIQAISSPSVAYA